MDRDLRWDRWTPGRIVATVVWLTGCGVVAWFLGIMGMLATATFFGDPPSGDQMLGGIVMLAGAAAAIVGGPFTVWFLRRSIPWLVATVASGVAALGGLAFVFSATG